MNTMQITDEVMPNFLIVGAAKSGTTSLYNYLSDHPDIFMSYPRKEPRFFVAEHFRDVQAENQRFEAHIRDVTVFDLEEYRRLFAAAGSAKAVGEASVAYLYFYETAIANIRKHAGDIKIIIVLRNPVDRAYSAYSHFQRDLNDPLTFEEAIAREEARMQENYLPLYRYIDQGRYFEQVKAYLEHFSEVKVLLFEDLVSRPRETVQEVYGFLGVDAAYIPENIHEKFNVSGFPKSRFLQEMIYGDSVAKRLLKSTVRRLVPEDRLERFKQLNLKRVPMQPETRTQLKAVYREDLLKLQELLQRDLSAWL